MPIEFTSNLWYNLRNYLEVYSMLYYCNRCGLVRDLFESDEKVCRFCKKSLEPVPEKYWLNGSDFLIDNKNKKLLREELVKTSTEYSEELFNQRYYWEIDRNNHIHSNLQKVKAVQQQASNIPKCPTCQSTNIRKIGGVERGASIWAFGIFSKKINKSFKCNSCGYTW